MHETPLKSEDPLKDLVAFQVRRRVERRASLNELTKKASELVMDDVTLEEAALVAKAARHGRKEERARRKV